MRTTSRYLLPLLILSTISSWVWSQDVTCPPDPASPQKTTVLVFGNGIDTTFENAYKVDLTKLEDGLETLLPSETFSSIEFRIAYNQTHGKLADLAESAEQKIPSAVPLFFQILAYTISGPPLGYQPIYLDWISSVSKETLLKDLKPDLDRHVCFYNGRLEEGKRIIVVAHSQGNYFANEAFARLNPLYRSEFRTVSVATPDSNVAGGGPYFTLRGDPIGCVPGSLKPLQINKSPSVCRTDASYPEICGGMLLGSDDIIGCHSFSESYMPGDVTGPLILKSIELNIPIQPPIHVSPQLTISTSNCPQGTNCSGPQGTTFTIQGTAFTPNQTVRLFSVDSSGSQTIVQPDGTADGNGNFSWQVVTTCSTAVGTFSIFASDLGSGRRSNDVTETVTDGNCNNLYTITDLGTLPGDSSSHAFAINNHGTVVGATTGGPDPNYNGCGGIQNPTKPFVWTAATGMQVLGPPPALVGFYANPIPACGGVALGINDQGMVVGYIDYGWQGAGNRPFIWTAETGIQLINTSSGSANGVNNSGQVVGTAGLNAFRWSADTGYQSLGFAGLNSFANGINSWGQVAGSAGSYWYYPLIWNVSGQAEWLDINDFIATLPPYTSFNGGNLQAINDAGTVVGYVRLLLTSGYAHSFAFRYRNTVAEYLGYLGSGSNSEAYAINNSEQIVGMSGDRPFLWTPTAGIRDLHSLLDVSGEGWTLYYTNAINDDGQIVGGGVHSGVQRAFLLTPAKKSQN